MQNFELLEGRGLLSATSIAGAVYATYDLETNDTLNTAQEIGLLNSQDHAAISGLIGLGSGLSTDADWYRFTLSETADVRLSAIDAVLSLYGDQSELFEFHNPLRHELLGQTDAGLEVTLDAGTYFVAATGLTNRFFHPFLADSGLAGCGLAYELTIDVSGVDFGDAVGAQVLGASIGDSEALSMAPVAIRVRFNQSLDESLIADGDTLQLFFTPTGSDSSAEELKSVGYWSFSHQLHELTVIPTTVLGTGDYRLVVSSRLLAPETGGPDYELEFSVTGHEGGVASDIGDDTVDSATDLGELDPSTVLQVSGAIGDDPNYDPNSSESTLMNLASDVDLYHFTVAGDGRWSLVAEAFAGRFGSPLDPSLTLFQQVEDGSLELVHFNGDTTNPVEAANGTLPLFTDSVLYVGLTAGEYFLAVSSATNDPQYGPDGVFNPTISHSGMNGVTSGAYVLNVSLTSDNDAPAVVTSSIAEGETLNYLPRTFSITFNEAVNLQQTAAESFLSPSEDSDRSVFFVSPDGTLIVPRFQAFDDATQTATFRMLDGLSNGAYELHLRAGLADLAGNALPSNDPSGDFVIRFNVDAPVRGIDGNALTRAAELGNDSIETAQDLDVLFPRELQSGVTLHRDLIVAESSADSDDYFRFEVLQSQLYFIALRVDDVAGVVPTTFELLDGNGQALPFVAAGEFTGQGSLPAGQYVLHVGGWSAEQAALIAYRIDLALSGNSENPTPLTSGATSAIGIRLHAATAIGQSVVPTTFVRPIVEAPRFAIPTQIASDAINTSEQTLASTGGSVAVSAMPRGLNDGFVARPLGAVVEMPSVMPSGPSETLFVKLWEKPDAEKVFVLLDESLPAIQRQKADATQAEQSETEPEANADEKSPSADATPENAESDEQTQSTSETLNRLLKAVNQSLPRSTRSADAPANSNVDPAPVGFDPQVSLETEPSDSDPRFAGLHAPMGALLAFAAVTSLKGEKKRQLVAQAPQS